MLFLLFFSFLAGFATILAPCIWPLLPLVLSVSSTGGKRKPLGLTLGVMTSFSLFTLFVSYLERILHIDANVFRLLAVAVIGLLGLSLLFPSLGARFEAWINRVLQPLQSRLRGKEEGRGFGAGYVAGFSIGLVWAPCAGPILATIATLAATQSVNFQVLLVTLSYALGLGIPLFLVSLGGSVVFARMRKVNRYTGLVQQAFGVIMIGVAALIYTNYDKTIQLKILEAFPSYGNLLSGLETNKTVSDQLDALRGRAPREETTLAMAGKLGDRGEAPEFTGITNWLNSPPLTMKGLRGKVVLVDFWTYSCVNCLRTLPNVKAWYQKYGPEHFVVVGVHAPEFAFEKDTARVGKALGQFGLTYPVAQDNDFKTWNAYHNEYWPAEYLIDAKGHIRLAHFGEGNYGEMDAAIRQLLTEAGYPPNGQAAIQEASGEDYDQTPESYLGLARLERFASNEKPAAGMRTYSLPQSLALHQIAYQGAWTLSGEAAQAGKGSALEIRFNAEKVFLVIGPAMKGDSLSLFLDGQSIGPLGGSDVMDGKVLLDSHRLYNLVDLKGKPASHLLRIQFDSPGTSVYAFTFG
ncbi:MAG TPA: cytochrome c biogenesis protein DipZ [bacterium]|nr:cytochrome c biogenesis protein DipZ [bacterium]